MPALTRFVLRHKALVALLWIEVAAAGVVTVGGTTHRMTNNFAMPGQAFRVDNQIAREYGNGGSQAPYVPAAWQDKCQPERLPHHVDTVHFVRHTEHVNDVNIGTGVVHMINTQILSDALAAVGLIAGLAAVIAAWAVAAAALHQRHERTSGVRRIEQHLARAAQQQSFTLAK
jgi:hypothetical protein